MNIESLIKQQAINLKATRRDIEIAPDIPEDLLEKWKRKYKSVIDDSTVDYLLVLSYTKIGNFAMTGNTLYYDNYMDGGVHCIDYKEILDVVTKEGGTLTSDKIYITLRDGKELCLDGCIDGINVILFAKLIRYIVGMAEKNGFNYLISKQGIPLFELSGKLKGLYLKILYNYSYIDNNMISSDEYNAIGKISVRIEVGEEIRNELREYISTISGRTKTGYLLKEAQKEMGNCTGEWDAFRYSLLQDILFIKSVREKNIKWREDGFVGSLMEALGLCPEQIDTMLSAIDLNKRIGQKESDVVALKKEWMILLQRVRYTKGYVPAKYLFCSGSVYGISCYSSLFKKDDCSQKAINKCRELIMQEIIENVQKVTNILISDMKFLAERLEEAINCSIEYKNHYNELIKTIKEAIKK